MSVSNNPIKSYATEILGEKSSIKRGEVISSFVTTEDGRQVKIMDWSYLAPLLGHGVGETKIMKYETIKRTCIFAGSFFLFISGIFFLLGGIMGTCLPLIGLGSGFSVLLIIDAAIFGVTHRKQKKYLNQELNEGEELENYLGKLKGWAEKIISDADSGHDGGFTTYTQAKQAKAVVNILSEKSSSDH